MLMTKFIYLVHEDDKGYLHTVVTRLSDGVQKYFFQATGSKRGMEEFLSSMTDELTEGYFPKAGKKGAEVDNWAFLGIDNNRSVAQEKARAEFDLRKMQ